MKQFEADSNANCVVALDVSKSMRFGSQGLTKLDYGRYLAASLLYLSSTQRDRVGLITFDTDVIEYVPPSAKHLEFALYALDRVGERGSGALAAPMLKLTDRLKRRGIVAVISDLCDEPEAVAKAISPLKFRGHDVIVFHVLDPAEIDFPYRVGELRRSGERRADADRAGLGPRSVRRSSRRTSTRSASASPTTASTTRCSGRRCPSITPSSAICRFASV